jgi:hypothetical protein
MARILRWAKHMGARLKTTDETVTSSTTLQNDDDLRFSALASTKYGFEIECWYDTPTAADFKYDVNGPAGASLVQIVCEHIAPGAAAFTDNAIQTAFAFTAIAVTETSGTNGFVRIRGIVHNGTTAGTGVMRWAQNTSNASATTVRAGSLIRFWEL